jgi:drug/metabolite transporter (DMT)-like permease
MTKLWPTAAAATTAIFVGSTIVATRFVIDQTSPISLALLRYLIGCCCLLPPVLLSARVRFERGDLLPIGLLGITQFGVVVALLNYALQFIPSARAALIFDHCGGGFRAWGEGSPTGRLGQWMDR